VRWWRRRRPRPSCPPAASTARSTALPIPSVMNANGEPTKASFVGGLGVTTKTGTSRIGDRRPHAPDSSNMRRPTMIAPASKISSSTRVLPPDVRNIGSNWFAVSPRAQGRPLLHRRPSQAQLSAEPLRLTTSFSRSPGYWWSRLPSLLGGQPSGSSPTMALTPEAADPPTLPAGPKRPTLNKAS
jgi:hypothetical protein